MAALKEFANFITLNMANLVTTYARLLAEGGQGYEALPANSRTASGRKLLKAVVEAFELESATPLIDIFNKNLTENRSPDAGSGASSFQRSGNITLPNPLLEVECLGQTLTPVVTNLEAGKFLWQILSESRATVLRGGIDVTGASQKIEVPRQAAKALGEDETFYQFLIDALPQNIYQVDQAGRITFGNKAYLHTLGMTLEECLGKTAYDLFPKELADKYTADDKRVIDSGEVFDTVESNRAPATGQTIYVRVIKAPVRNSAGEIVGLQSISWDVTERKEMEDKLGKRVRELNCLNEIGREMEEAPSVAELLQWVTERIPPAMNYPELCQAAIEFDGNVYGLAEAIDLPAQMTHGLYIKGKVLGRVYIAYTEKQDFLDEESAMLGAIASRLSGYIENQGLLVETEAALAEVKRQARREQTIREIAEKMRAATSLEQLVRVAAEELGWRFSAEYALVELGTDVSEPHLNRQTNGRE